MAKRRQTEHLRRPDEGVVACAQSTSPKSMEIRGIAQGYAVELQHVAAGAEGRYNIDLDRIKGGQPVYVHNQHTHNFIFYHATEAEWQLVHTSSANPEIVILRGKANGQPVALGAVIKWLAGTGHPMPSVQASYIFGCPVCVQTFKSETALTSHIRDKQDPAHGKYRRSRASSEQPTAVKKPRTRAQCYAETGSTKGGSGPDSETTGADAGTRAAIVERTQEDEILHLRRKLLESDENLRQCQARHENDMTLLRKENASLQERNASMLEEMNKWRAESSAAARGNDNINSKFPFNREIIQSYRELCDGLGVFCTLLDIEDGDAGPIELA